jgi:hypothetical protein
MNLLIAGSEMSKANDQIARWRIEQALKDKNK